MLIIIVTSSKFSHCYKNDRADDECDSYNLHSSWFRRFWHSESLIDYRLWECNLWPLDLYHDKFAILDRSGSFWWLNVWHSGQWRRKSNGFPWTNSGSQLIRLPFWDRELGNKSAYLCHMHWSFTCWVLVSSTSVGTCGLRCNHYLGRTDILCMFICRDSARLRILRSKQCTVWLIKLALNRHVNIHNHSNSDKVRVYWISC